jgi:hypothetical protein
MEPADLHWDNSIWRLLLMFSKGLLGASCHDIMTSEEGNVMMPPCVDSHWGLPILLLLSCYCGTGGTLWHLQTFWQYITVEFTLSSVSFTPLPALLEQFQQVSFFHFHTWIHTISIMFALLHTFLTSSPSHWCQSWTEPGLPSCPPFSHPSTYSVNICWCLTMCHTPFLGLAIQQWTNQIQIPTHNELKF